MKNKILIIPIILALSGVNGSSLYRQNNHYIAIAIAYKKLPCGTTTAENAVYVYAEHQSGKYDAQQMNTFVKNTVANNSGVPLTDIQPRSSYMPNVAIISIEYPMSGYNCTYTKYFIGEGSSSELALADAIKSKNVWSKLPHKVVLTVGAK